MENIIQIYDNFYYGNGEFDFVRDKSTKEFLKSAHKAITLCKLWDWMRIYQPPPNKGFMWSKTPELDRLNQQMWKDPINENHSGYSYACIMRNMEYIAKNGYKKFKNTYY